MKSTSSPLILVKQSSIHNKGIFARIDIAKDTRIIEYVGEKISKAESIRRADIFLKKSKQKKEHGAVYIFELNKRYDIDGAVSYNTARYINHSCNPNCEAHIIRGHIWIVSIRNIKKGEELGYDYGYDVEHFEDHKCFCSAKNCRGYIVAEDQWHKLKKRLKKTSVDKK